VTALEAEQGIRRTRLVVGMVGGHSPDGLLAALAPGAELLIACQPAWKRAQSAEAIAEAAWPYCADVRVVHVVAEAVRSALAGAGLDTLVLVTGSFYTVGEVQPEQVQEWWQRSG
jgi:folylpolyglutamate synthase/dihydropteroate synthase